MPNTESMKSAVQAELDKIAPTPAPTEPEPKSEVPTPAEPAKKDDDKEPATTPADADAKKVEEKDDPATTKVELDKKFVPYERFKEINEKYKSLKQERDEYIKNRKPVELDDDEKEDHEKLKKLGFLTKEEQEDEFFKLKQEQIKQEEQEILDKEFKKLEREFDWSDWLPKFSKQEVMDRGIEHQVFDPKSAYIVMNLENIINHFVKKSMVDVKKQPIVGGKNDIKNVDITPKEKLSLKGNDLQNFLTERIKWMMG